jgi:hypothetical protein
MNQFKSYEFALHSDPARETTGWSIQRNIFLLNIQLLYLPNSSHCFNYPHPMQNTRGLTKICNKTDTSGQLQLSPSINHWSYRMNKCWVAFFTDIMYHIFHPSLQFFLELRPLNNVLDMGLDGVKGASSSCQPSTRLSQFSENSLPPVDTGSSKSSLWYVKHISGWLLRNLTNK